MGGMLRADDIIERALSTKIDWLDYEDAFQRAYGRPSGMTDILHRIRGGDESARDDFRQLFVFGPEDAGDFPRFQAKYNAIVAVSANLMAAMSNRFTQEAADEIHQDLGSIAQHLRDEAIGYAEVRVMLRPTWPRHVRRQYYERCIDRMRKLNDDDLQLRLAISIPRAAPWDTWADVRDLLDAGAHDIVPAIDFCHVEEGFPPKMLRDWVHAFRDWNASYPDRALALLYHVGESFRDKSIESAIRWCDEAATMLGAHRLGHAIALGIAPAAFEPHERRERASERLDQIAYDLAHADALRAAGVPLDADALRREAETLHTADPKQQVTISYDHERLEGLAGRQRVACERIKASGAVIEVCPTSNQRIMGLRDPAHHQVHRFIETGLPFVVGADDPGIFDCTLADELTWVATHTGRAVDDLAAAAWAWRGALVAGRGNP